VLLLFFIVFIFPQNKLISQNSARCLIWTPRCFTWNVLLFYFVADFKSSGGIASPVFTSLYIRNVPTSLPPVHNLPYLQLNLFMSTLTVFVATPQPKTIFYPISLPN
jgi:hypothetical protein